MSEKITFKNVINKEYNSNNDLIHFEYMITDDVMSENKIPPLRLTYDKLYEKTWLITTILTDNLVRTNFYTPTTNVPVEMVIYLGMVEVKKLMLEQLNTLTIIDMVTSQILRSTL